MNDVFEDEEELTRAEELAEEGCYDEAVYQAYIDLGIYADDNDVTANEVEGAYNGQWDNDEEFAQDLFESLYEIPDHLHCYVNWSHVARDLMMDYLEQDGHYFRQV